MSTKQINSSSSSLPLIHHQSILLSTGIQLSVRRCIPNITPNNNNNPLIILVHGFPDTSYGWRKIIQPLCQLTGCEVIAPDMRGYGETKCLVPDAVNDSSFQMENICNDLIALLDAVGARNAIYVGHDWGGTSVFNLTAHSCLPTSKYYRRVLAVASFCTPFFPSSSINPWPKLQQNPGRFAYQLYFHTQQAVDEFNSNPRLICNKIICPWNDAHHGMNLLANTSPDSKGVVTSTTTTTGNDTNGLLSKEELDMYTVQFTHSGFLNPMRWYRNIERNWQFNLKTIGVKINIPTLMVAAEHDIILTPSMTKMMPPHFENGMLTVVTVNDSGHWLLQEKPTECIEHLVKFVSSVVVKGRNNNKL
jgi:soluble epoxide hydrolase/lipid-phosphate phosphatase